MRTSEVSRFLSSPGFQRKIRIKGRGGQRSRSQITPRLKQEEPAPCRLKAAGGLPAPQRPPWPGIPAAVRAGLRQTDRQRHIGQDQETRKRDRERRERESGKQRDRDRRDREGTTQAKQRQSPRAREAVRPKERVSEQRPESQGTRGQWGLRWRKVSVRGARLQNFPRGAGSLAWRPGPLASLLGLPPWPAHAGWPVL